jgi:protein-tyrosine phosphatase
MKKLLFVCSGNKDRSPTAEYIYKNDPRFEVRSAGTLPYVKTFLTKELILWADAIVAMERGHEEYIRENFADEVKNRPIFCLDVSDNYKFLADPLRAEIRTKMEPVLALIERLELLKADLEHICGVLAKQSGEWGWSQLPDAYEDYDFVEDINKRVEELKISSKVIAHYTGIQRRTIEKWLGGLTRPNGKERMKELGMILGMGEKELSEFLLKNQYSGLYSKNPFDAACMKVLRSHAGKINVVLLYHKELDKRGIPLLQLQQTVVTYSSGPILQSLKKAISAADFEVWIEYHSVYFDAARTVVLPSEALTRFVLLHVDSSIHDMYAMDNLPDPLRRLLWKIQSGERYALHGLRRKLIAFGLYSNMTDADIDRMLRYARLMPLTKLSSKLDTAIFVAMRLAHERFPYYEYSSVKRVKDNIIRIMLGMDSKGSSPEVYNEWAKEYIERFDKLRNPYKIPPFEGQQQFEALYADHLSDYMCDIFRLLICYGVLEGSEVSPYIKLLSNAEPEL